MTTLAARTTREGKWWVVEVPIGDAVHLTQGHTLKEAQEMAQDLLTIWAAHLGEPSLGEAVVELEVDGSAKYATDRVRRTRETADKAAAHARQVQIDAAVELRQEGLPVQDIATLMGITKGRVSQLLHA